MSAVYGLYVYIFSAGEQQSVAAMQICQ